MYLDYDNMIERALLDVVKEALLQVAKNGLAGNHHFYITFRTDFPGVQIPSFLRAEYPEELTIVLQHQFWDLRVTTQGFSVGLSFDETEEQLHVPFAALLAFADPSCEFELEFHPEIVEKVTSIEHQEGVVARSRDDHAPAPVTEGSNVFSLENFRKKP